ncbi:hypothetical protein NEN36_26350, partial [Escherichia coli]|nr:hypothetical protein [Escherichia coli]
EGMPESHETMARPERVRMYSGATVRHVLEQMRQGWPSYGFPALSTPGAGGLAVSISAGALSAAIADIMAALKGPFKFGLW